MEALPPLTANGGRASRTGSQPEARNLFESQSKRYHRSLLPKTLESCLVFQNYPAVIAQIRRATQQEFVAQAIA